MVHCVLCTLTHFGILRVMTDIVMRRVLESYAVRAKAERYIAVAFGLHASQQLALAIVACYMLAHGRDQGGIDRITGWSGAGFRWKHKIKKNILECVAAGVLERVKCRQGSAIRLTGKGLHVLSAWHERERLIYRDLMSKGRKARRKRARLPRSL